MQSVRAARSIYANRTYNTTPERQAKNVKLRGASDYSASHRNK